MRIKSVFTICVFCVYCGNLAWAIDEVRIRGQIIYDPTGQPLKHVVVKLLRPHRSIATLIKNLGQEDAPDLLAITTTDSKGNFSFETAQRGPYEIACFRGGGHFGSGLPNIDPKKFVLIRYKADPAAEMWHGDKKR